MSSSPGMLTPDYLPRHGPGLSLSGASMSGAEHDHFESEGMFSDTCASLEGLTHSVRSRRMGANLTIVADKAGLAQLEEADRSRRQKEQKDELLAKQQEILEEQRRADEEAMKGKKVKKGFFKAKNKLLGALDSINLAIDNAYYKVTGNKDKANKKTLTRDQIEEYKRRLAAKKAAQALRDEDRKKEAEEAKRKQKEVDEGDMSDTSIGNKYKWYQLRKNAPWVPIAQDEDPTDFIKREKECTTSGGRHRIRVKQAFSLHAQYNEELELSRTQVGESTKGLTRTTHTDASNHITLTDTTVLSDSASPKPPAVLGQCVRQTTEDAGATRRLHLDTTQPHSDASDEASASGSRINLAAPPHRRKGA